MPEAADRLSSDDFAKRIEMHKIPSQKQMNSSERDQEDQAEESRSADASTNTGTVGIAQIDHTFHDVRRGLHEFGLWQMVMYIRNSVVRAIFDGEILSHRCHLLTVQVRGMG